jgi:hypothetical protein
VSTKPVVSGIQITTVAASQSGIAKTALAATEMANSTRTSTVPASVAAPKPVQSGNPVMPVVANAAPGISAPSVNASASNVVAAQVVSTSNLSPTVSSFPAPTIVAAKPGSASARVFFTVPQNAAALISSYTVVAYAGGVTTGIRAAGTSSPIIVTGLTNGTDYTFYVIANGKSGMRAASALSNSVTPLGIFAN